MEATGKLHRLAHSELSAAGFAVAIVNPYRSRKFALASLSLGVAISASGHGWEREFRRPLSPGRETE